MKTMIILQHLVVVMTVAQTAADDHYKPTTLKPLPPQKNSNSDHASAGGASAGAGGAGAGGAGGGGAGAGGAGADGAGAGGAGAGGAGAGGAGGGAGGGGASGAGAGAGTICPASFLNIPGTAGCYALQLTGGTWAASLLNCQSLNSRAHLVVIDNATQDNALLAYLKTLPIGQGNVSVARRTEVVCEYLPAGIVRHRCGARPAGQCGADFNGFWTAGQRAVVNDCSTPLEWKVSDGVIKPMTYSNWYEGGVHQPDCYPCGDSCRESCVQTFNDRNGWNDYNCGSGLCAICQV